MCLEFSLFVCNICVSLVFMMPAINIIKTLTGNVEGSRLTRFNNTLCVQLSIFIKQNGLNTHLSRLENMFLMRGHFLRFGEEITAF